MVTRNTKPQNPVVKTFSLTGNCGLEYSDERSTASDSTNSYLHLHVATAHKTYIVLRAEFNLSLPQDHVQRLLASINS